VRDWSYPYEAPYGADGGKKILQRRLEVSDKQHPELQLVRQHIKSCFIEIGCFLMPYPGKTVATNPNFDGRMTQIEPEFKEQLNHLVVMLLHPDNLMPKKINGDRVKARDLITYFKSYIEIYKSNELPEVRSIVTATAEANNLTAAAAAKDMYVHEMEKICGVNLPYIKTNELDTAHKKNREAALKKVIDV
jgi:atlastin